MPCAAQEARQAGADAAANLQRRQELRDDLSDVPVPPSLSTAHRYPLQHVSGHAGLKSGASAAGAWRIAGRILPFRRAGTPRRHNDVMPKRPSWKCRAADGLACARSGVRSMQTNSAGHREGRTQGPRGRGSARYCVRDRQAAKEVVAHEVVQRVAELLEDL